MIFNFPKNELFSLTQSCGSVEVFSSRYRITMYAMDDTKANILQVSQNDNKGF